MLFGIGMERDYHLGLDVQYSVHGKIPTPGEVWELFGCVRTQKPGLGKPTAQECADRLRMAIASRDATFSDCGVDEERVVM